MILKIKNLTYRYNLKGLAGVNNCNLHLESGQVLCLLGPSGAGKSTLLQLITQKLPPQSGSIELNFPAEQITLLRQNETTNMQSSVLETIIQKPKSQSSLTQINQARQLIEDFELTNEINRPLSTLSGGQYQRTLLAQKLFPKTTLLLLDEPFEHMDEQLRRELITLTFNWCRSKKIAILWVTHQNREALGFSDTIAIINHGHIIQHDEPTKIYFKPNSLFSAQFFGPTNTLVCSFANDESGCVLKTPIGSWPWPHSGHKVEGIVVIRPEHISCQIQKDEKHQLPLCVLKTYFQGDSWLAKCQLREITIWVKLHHHQLQNKKRLFAHLEPQSFHVLTEI